MLLARSPLRISVGGGGTDLPSFYNGVGTTFSSLAISRYVYVSVAMRFYEQLLIKYIKLEEAETLDNLENELFREIIRAHSDQTSHLEVASFSEVPGGTGLGSSGSFSCALIAAFEAKKGFDRSADWIARAATYVEMITLSRPIGLNDQYISAHGGFKRFQVSPDGSVTTFDIALSSEAEMVLIQNWQLFFLGTTRLSSSALIRESAELNVQGKSGETRGSDLVSIGRELTDAVISADLKLSAEIIDYQFKLKLERQRGLTEPVVMEAAGHAKANGALATKLVGAGGSGFLLTLSDQPERLSKEMSAAGFTELTFEVAAEGTKVLVNDQAKT